MQIELSKSDLLFIANALNTLWHMPGTDEANEALWQEDAPAVPALRARIAALLPGPAAPELSDQDRRIIARAIGGIQSETVIPRSEHFVVLGVTSDEIDDLAARWST